MDSITSQQHFKRNPRNKLSSEADIDHQIKSDHTAEISANGATSNHPKIVDAILRNPYYKNESLLHIYVIREYIREIRRAVTTH